MPRLFPPARSEVTAAAGQGRDGGGPGVQQQQYVQYLPCAVDRPPGCAFYGAQGSRVGLHKGERRTITFSLELLAICQRRALVVLVMGPTEGPAGPDPHPPTPRTAGKGYSG